MQQLRPQFGTSYFFVDSWANEADTIHIKCTHWTGWVCFCNGCNHSKAASGKGAGRQTFWGLPSELCNEADVWWTCLAREQACSEAGVSQAGVSNLKSHWRGGRTCCPRSQAGLPALPEDDTLFPVSAKSGVTQPDLSQSLGGALRSCGSIQLSDQSSLKPGQLTLQQGNMCWSVPGPACPGRLSDRN